MAAVIGTMPLVMKRGLASTFQVLRLVTNSPRYAGPTSYNCPLQSIMTCRTIATTSINYRRKHYNPKYRKERARKFLKVELPDYEEERMKDKLTPDELRAKMKEKGMAPPRPWQEKPIFISSTADIFEPYVPPEGDGKISILSSAGAKQTVEFWGKKSKSYMSLRKIRTFDEDFEPKEFAPKAQEIYIEALTTLQTNPLNEDKLHELITEKCYPEIVLPVSQKTIRWHFIKSLEPPRVTHLRCTEMITKDNIFAQATVRMHTQQTLAVYDRFGRLMHGSEVVVKDVLEYVVFEKHLSNQYGQWRVHGKIIPSWMPPRDSILKTFRKPDVTTTLNITKPETTATSEEKETKPSPEVQPALA